MKGEISFLLAVANIRWSPSN